MLDEKYHAMNGMTYAVYRGHLYAAWTHSGNQVRLVVERPDADPLQEPSEWTHNPHLGGQKKWYRDVPSNKVEQMFKALVYGVYRGYRLEVWEQTVENNKRFVSLILDYSVPRDQFKYNVLDKGLYVTKVPITDLTELSEVWTPYRY